MSINKTIANRLDAITSPVRSELRLAQEQALERIQNVVVRAQTEVAQKARFMTSEQRFEKALQECEKAEEQMLSALSSLVKAVSYIAPFDNPFAGISPIKDIKGQVIEQSPAEPKQLKRSLFGRKK